MTLAVLGRGAIGRYVLEHLPPEVSVVQLVRERATNTEGKVAQVTCVSDLPDDVSLIVDCAGHSGLAEHGPDALSGGIDVLTLSIGALADDQLENRLRKAADHGGAALYLGNGAIGALDVLRAAAAGDALERVTYVGRKPPVGWLGSPAEQVVDLAAPLVHPVIHFSGSARAAALSYPKNANVAAAVAVSGLGFDQTRVELIADPTVARNTHEIIASGTFGEMTFSVAGNSLADNPRSSALAAMSLLAAIENRSRAIRF